ncbi:uncharacterized protein H6S33_000508 [Morchella sextelata]|uniref:uncharacterized protein n=1 Tax=Morchella sextelata TaxID=1174677 RepID=UPI001D0423C8|nr:uncharacterized protein H6S33_000508 [Morchella sextelata]KAH0614872.1 hypothetical protein H6S33_000508 [Morchella sextelata]
MSSDYGSDSDLFELYPMLGMHQGSHTCPNNDARIMNNHVKIVGEEEFGDIDDVEMLEAITYLEKHTTSELVKDKWDSDSDMDGASIFDDYPTTENQANNEKENIQNGSREQFLHLHSLPVTSHKPVTQEKLSTDDKIQSQNQSLSIPNKDSHVSEICPLEELPTSPEPGIVIENFSTPSDVKFTLNDYSQDQEVFDPDLQRSTPPENFVGVSKCFQNTTSDTCASEAKMRESCENLDILGEINDIEELVSGLDTISYEENEEIPDGAVGVVGPENESTKGKGDEDADVDVVGIEKEIEIKGNLEEEGDDEDESEESTLYMSKKRKAQRKTKPAKATRERKPLKKRKVRVVDPSQLKLSDYIGFSKPPSIRPRYDEEGNLNPFVRPAFLPMVPEEPWYQE